MQVRVIRGLGDKQGPDITSELLTQTSAGIVAGEQAINEETNKKEYEYVCPILSSMRPNSVVSVTTIYGQEIKGLLRYMTQSLTISDSGNGKQVSATTSLKVLAKR